jgi:VIT1/CCC1 family predicted Fe2+/Mn2+ transporter
LSIRNISLTSKVAGVSGSGLASTDILLTAIAGALAGAVSMAAGEFIATKSQNEVIQGEYETVTRVVCAFLMTVIL